MADKKFSQFTNGNEVQIGDEVVGLRPSAPTANFRFDFPGAGIKDSDGNFLFAYDTIGALAVNYLQLVNAATGNPALLTADGTDSDIDISIQPKGTGQLILDELNWPTADGAANTFLATDGAGNLFFFPGGVATSIVGTANQVLANGTSGVAQTGSVTLTTPQDIAATSSPTFANLTLTNPLPMASGGSSKALTASAGGIVWTDANSMEVLAGTATANQLLLSGNAATPSWSTSTYPSTNAINTLLYASAANTMAALAATNRASLASSATGVPTWLALTDGQLVIGSTAGAPAAASLTAGAGISISNGANSITISGTGSGIGWTEVTGTTQAMAADTGYVANNGALVVFTLPVTAAFGTVINVVGKGAGGWRIDQNGGQNIQIGSVSSSVGAGGSVASTNRFDSLELLCTTANTTWTILGGGQSAGFTIV